VLTVVKAANHGSTASPIVLIVLMLLVSLNQFSYVAQFSGNSLRSGFLTSAARCGASGIPPSATSGLITAPKTQQDRGLNCGPGDVGIAAYSL
jgi:hypothetical protein